MTMPGRELTYPSIWPRYIVIAAVALVGVVSLHLFSVGFAHWALRHPGPALLHALTFEYAGPMSTLVRCAGPALDSSSNPQADRMRAHCQRWWQAFGWYANTRGADYLGFAMVAAAAAAAWIYFESQRRLRPPEGERRAEARFSRPSELTPFSVARSPDARPEVGAMPMGRTLPHPGAPGSLDLTLPFAQRFQHVWVLGVTGAGKTSSGFKRWLAADAMLDGAGGAAVMSSVVVDVKHPDIFTSIAPIALQRRRRLYVWAPFDDSGTTMAINFLDYVPYPMDPQTAASLILSNMPDYARRDPFWRGVERQLLTLLIQMVIEEPAEAFASDALEGKVRHLLELREADALPPPRSLAFVLALSYLSVDEFIKLFDMWAEPSKSKWRDRFATIQSAEERTVVGGMLGIQQALSVFAERSVILSTSYSNFRLETLAFQPTTLIIGLPTQPRPNRQVLTALFLRQLLDVLGRLGEQRRPEGLEVPVSLYLDEIGTLGYIGNLPDYVATYRDIRVSFVLATQDTQQLVGLFGQEQAEVLIANLHTRVVFGYDLRPDQATRISQDLGERTVVEPAAHYLGGPLSQRRSGTRLVYQVRPLVSPDELRSMQPFQAIVVLPGNRKVRVYMEPVHQDTKIPPPLERPLPWPHLYKHNALLDDVLGPAPHMDTAAAFLQRPAPPPIQLLADTGPDGTGAADGADASQASTPQPTHLAGESSADVPAQPAEAQISGAKPGHAIPSGDGREPQSPPAQTASPKSTGDNQSDLSEGNLVGFFRALLDGKLRDDRVADGAVGFVYADRRGEALVPWGYFMDFGRKAQLRFVLLNSQWVAEKLVGPRVTVMHNGRAVTCMTFTRQACRMLPEPLQQDVARKFRKVNPQAVRASAQQATSATPDGKPARTATEAPPFGGREDGTGRDLDAASLPFLAECLELLCAQAARFAGHPDYKEEHSPLGRWRHTARDGEELLLVRREVLEERIAQLGGRPETVFAVWKGAWVLRPGEGDRLGYRLGSGDSRSLLAFRWSKLRALGFPGPPLEPAGANVDEDASG